jgi:hypothetical protein
MGLITGKLIKDTKKRDIIIIIVNIITMLVFIWWAFNMRYMFDEGVKYACTNPFEICKIGLTFP